VVLCSKIALPEVADHRGRLMFAEDGRHVPFPIRRIFAIYDIPSGIARGGHAHRSQEQLLVMLAGACRVVIDEGSSKSEEALNSPTQGLYVPPRVWIELKDFARASVCLVLTSDHYDEHDYIRDYDEFKHLIVDR
jgi:dTDP-4-dehydrorhamnose 3,5-epimerase-like enzyme